MGNEVLGWGKSLPVPSIQEIVRNDSACIPERYIQEQGDRPLSFVKSEQSEVPVINFHLLAEGDEDERQKLHFACKDWGFFQLTNHGVAEEVLCKIKSAVKAFFELPLEEKKKYSMAANDIQGYGQAYVVSDDQKLDWNDLIFLLTSPSERRNLKYWPITLSGFREAIEEYSEALKKVTLELYKNLSLLMSMDEDGLVKLHETIVQSMRMNYYPACSRPDLVLGVSPHSDGGAITLLLQDDDITGLQIKHEAEWIPVKPIPSALVVNVGDALEVWSNGVYKSIEHRAATNEKRSRISVATFVSPDEQVELCPVKAMVDEQRPEIYKKIKFIDYVRATLGRKMDGKAHTDVLKI